MDPSRPVPIARELDAIIGASLQPRRVALTVIVGFAILALSVSGDPVRAASARWRPLGSYWDISPQQPRDG